MRKKDRSIEEIQKSVWDTLDSITESTKKQKVEDKKRLIAFEKEMKKRAESFEKEMKDREIAFEKEMKNREIALEKEIKERKDREIALEKEMKDREIAFEKEMKKREIALEKEMKKREIALEKERKERKDREIAFEKEMKKREIALKKERKERKERAADDLKRKIEFDEEIRRINESMGHYTNNIGYIAEEYFFNSFKAGKKNFFGENFDDIEKNVKGIKKDFKDEYDILMRNGKSIIIVEVKNKANLNDIPKIQRKAETFRENFPDFKNHKVYLGFASMGFYDEIEQECKAKGIAIIKQIGETLVIFDEHLKVY